MTLQMQGSLVGQGKRKEQRGQVEKKMLKVGGLY